MLLVPWSFPVVVLGVVCAHAIPEFPVASLSVGKDFLKELNAPGSRADALATAALLPPMRSFFAEVQNAIVVEKGDIEIRASFPDVQIDGDCHHKIEAEDPKATGTLLEGSSLSFGVTNLSWHSISVFADANVSAKLDITADVCVRVGEEIFGHHCSQIARDTVGIDVLSDGRNAIGLNMTAYNAHVAKVNGTWALVFSFHATVVGKVLTWNVEKVHADNCKITILGIEIASVCGTIERHVKDQAQKLTQHATQITAPKLLKRLEGKINTAIGSQVTIPLKIEQLLVE